MTGLISRVIFIWPSWDRANHSHVYESCHVGIGWYTPNPKDMDKPKELCVCDVSTQKHWRSAEEGRHWGGDANPCYEHILLADLFSGESKISKRGHQPPRSCTILLFDHFFPITAWKWRKIGQEDGAPASPRSANAVTASCYLKHYHSRRWISEICTFFNVIKMSSSYMSA